VNETHWLKCTARAISAAIQPASSRFRISDADFNRWFRPPHRRRRSPRRVKITSPARATSELVNQSRFRPCRGRNFAAPRRAGARRSRAGAGGVAAARSRRVLMGERMSPQRGRHAAASGVYGGRVAAGLAGGPSWGSAIPGPAGYSPNGWVMPSINRWASASSAAARPWQCW